MLEDGVSSADILQAIKSPGGGGPSPGTRCPRESPGGEGCDTKLGDSHWFEELLVEYPGCPRAVLQQGGSFLDQSPVTEHNDQQCWIHHRSNPAPPEAKDAMRDLSADGVFNLFVKKASPPADPAAESERKPHVP